MWWGQWRERPRKKRMDQTSVSTWGRREGREGGKEGRSRYKAGFQNQERVWGWVLKMHKMLSLACS